MCTCDLAAGAHYSLSLTHSVPFSVHVENVRRFLRGPAFSSPAFSVPPTLSLIFLKFTVSSVELLRKMFPFLSCSFIERRCNVRSNCGTASSWVSQTSRSFSREVVGIASLAGDLYVALKGETSVHVMDSLTFHTSRSIVVPDMRAPTRDLAAGAHYSLSLTHSVPFSRNHPHSHFSVTTIAIVPRSTVLTATSVSYGGKNLTPCKIQTVE